MLLLRICYMAWNKEFGGVLNRKSSGFLVGFEKSVDSIWGEYWIPSNTECY